MVDTWQPNMSTESLSTEKLVQLAAIINGQDSAKEDLKNISESDIQLIAGQLNTLQEAWILAIESLSTEQILNLCIIFTLGEMAFSSWTFGANNPTIYFLRYLKSQKKINVEKDFIRWLKRNTDNRYIPYGPAL